MVEALSPEESISLANDLSLQRTNKEIFRLKQANGTGLSLSRNEIKKMAIAAGIEVTE